MMIDNKYLAGSLLTVAPLMLFQDFMGREGYSEWVLNHWVTPWFTVPLALLSLAIGVAIVIKSR